MLVNFWIELPEPVVVVEASVPKAYLRVALAIARTLSGAEKDFQRFLPCCVEPGASPQPVFGCLWLLFTKGGLGRGRGD